MVEVQSDSQFESGIEANLQGSLINDEDDFAGILDSLLEARDDYEEEK